MAKLKGMDAALGGAMEKSLYGVPEKITRPRLAPKEIVEMARKVRAAHHENRLEDARIKYLIEPGQATGDVSLGKAKKMSRMNQLVASVDFLIVLNWAAWQRLDDETREALLDHELTHCAAEIDAEGEIKGWKIRHHDVEEFAEIIERRGLWSTGLEQIAQPMARLVQGELFGKAKARRA